MITDDAAYKLQLWRLAHDIDWLSDEGAEALLRQLIEDTPAADKPFMAKLCADAGALRHSEPWRRALRTMRELRWSSY
jgi:hypothetical protein